MSYNHLKTKYLPVIDALKDSFYFKDTLLDLESLELKGLYRNSVLSESDNSAVFEQFLNDLKSNFPDLKVCNKTHAQQPSWNVEIFIEVQEFEIVATSISLQLSISRLTPYFSLLGEGVKLDRTRRSFSISGGNQFVGYLPFRLHASSNPILGSVYNELRVLVQRFFKDYKQIPFEILFEKIKGLRIDEVDKDRCLYEAFFMGEISNYFSVVGDRCFPSEEWQI